VVVLSPGALKVGAPEAELPESASEAIVVLAFGTDDEVVVGSIVIDEGDVVDVVGAMVDVVVVVVVGG